MTNVDRSYGDWYLKSINGNIYIDAGGGNGVTTIIGNLVVIGKQTIVGSIDTYIADNIITLNANVTTGDPVLNAGIEVRRGDYPTVSFIWNELIDRWQITDDGITFGNLMMRLRDDPDPHLGGHLYVNDYEIRSDPGQNIIFNPGTDETTANAAVEIKYTSGNVDPVFGSTLLTANIPGNGQTGLYVTNFVADNEELITKKKSIIYSLVL